MRPRVLYLATEFPTVESPVIGIFVREHARAAARHCDVAVIHLQRERAAHGAFDVTRVHGEEVPTWRVRYRRFPRPASYAAFFAGALAAFRRLRREGFDPDVIHAHSHLAALPALVLGALLRKPVVYTEHWGIFLDEVPGEIGPGMRRLARLVLERADAVLPVSEAMRDALAELAPRARFRVVPNAVDEELFFPAARPGGDGSRRLLTVGLFTDDGVKGVDIMLEAFALLARRDDVRLDLVGDGDLRREHEALAARLGVAPLVTFHGIRPKSDVATLMRSADLFLLSSRGENNPCVVLEALASGLPVVATRVGGVPEVVDEASGILTAPEDPAAFAAGVAEALDRLDRFDRSAIAERAHGRYGLARVGRSLAGVYEDVLAAHRRT